MEATSTTGGYTCTLCHNWIGWGSVHTCSWLTPMPQSTYVVTDPRLPDLLERIATALEQLVNRRAENDQ